MEYNRVIPEHAKELLDFLRRLDAEAKYMLYKVGERQANVHDLRSHIKSLKSNSIIMAAWDTKFIVGYLALYGGRMARNQHVATLSCGVLQAWQGQGVATELWKKCLNEKSTDIRRVELTVVCQNTGAIRLYEKWGFVEEGYKYQSFKAEDGYLSELLMSRRVW